jgi:hypothetical protein
VIKGNAMCMLPGSVGVACSPTLSVSLEGMGYDFFAYGSVTTPIYLLKNEQNILHSTLESVKTTLS